MRTAIDILLNLQETIEPVERAYEAFQSVSDGDQHTLEGECGLTRIEQATSDIQTGVAQFETCIEALRERFQTAME